MATLPRSMFRKLSYIAFVLHAYVAWRLLTHLPVGSIAFALTAAWLLVSAIATPLWPIARQFARPPLRDPIIGLSVVALGAFSTLLVLTFVRDMGLLASAALGASAARTMLLEQGALAVPALAAVATFAGFVNARRRARVRRVDVPIAGLPAALHGFSVAQISDVHVGPTIKRDYVERIVDAVNGLDADIVAVTGDLVDGTVADLAPHTEPMSRLRARYGAFFVTGNHEYYAGAGPWLHELRRLGLEVLLNEHVVVRHEGAAVVVAGVTDEQGGYFHPAHRTDPHAAIAGAPADAALKLLLAHRPGSAHDAAKAGFDLQLSGHTHGGQFFPWNYVVRLFHPVTTGLNRVDGLWVYVSRGTGYWGPPKRLGAPSEITYLRLVSDRRAS